MKTHLLKLTAFLLILSGIAASCSHEEQYPKEISFTEYVLPTPCQWTNLPYDEKVIVINSNEELSRYFSCTEGDYPAVDFTKHSLLLVSGNVTHDIADITIINLQQLSENSYILDVEVLLNNTTNSNEWVKALIIEKINNNYLFELDLKYNDSGYPMDVPFTEYSLEGTSCKWTGLGPDGIIIINNNIEFGNYITCTGGGNYPAIDFSKYTLLLAYGVEAHGLNYLYTTLQQLSVENYIMTVTFRVVVTTVMTYWRVPIIISKIDEDANIKLIYEKI